MPDADPLVMSAPVWMSIPELLPCSDTSPGISLLFSAIVARGFSDTPILSMSGKDEEGKRVQFGARDFCIESLFPLSFHPK